MSTPGRLSGRAVLLAVLGALALVVVAVGLLGQGGGGRRATVDPVVAGGAGDAAAVSASVDPGAGALNPGTPAAAATVAGAVAAVERIVAVEPGLVRADPAADAVVAGWTSPGARAAIEADVDAARAALAAVPGGPYSFDAAVLAAKASLTGTDRGGEAEVAVWCSEVVFAKGVPVYSAFVTEHFVLVYLGGRWLITAAADTPGPSVPLQGSATPAAEAQSALAGFVPVGMIDGAG
jgi:hypothetical protein